VVIDWLDFIGKQETEIVLRKIVGKELFDE